MTPTNSWFYLNLQGFVPFHMDFSGRQNTTYTHLDNVNRKNLRRQQMIVESRNYVCAHMKRNDPVTRRFIQYALMRPSAHLILVRDGRDGRIVVAPDKQHRWITRSRPGLTAVGRQSHDDDGWDVELEVDSYFFELAEAQREWHFGFTSYYEIYMWDLCPGGKPLTMYHHIRELLSKARRIRGNRGKFAHTKHIMETLTREPVTLRVRQIKPGEEAESLFDELAGPNAQFWVNTSDGKSIRTSEEVVPGVGPYFYYNDTDAAEDAVIFDEESLQGLPEDMPFVEITNPMLQLENARLPLTLLNKTVKKIEDRLPPALGKALGLIKDMAPLEAPSSSVLTPDDKEYVPGSEQFPFSLPPIWQQAHELLGNTFLSLERTRLLEKLDFASVKFTLTPDQLSRLAHSQEIMERDRAYGKYTRLPF